MGYIRVPKVSVCGEFSLRGEVLDIFLPCDEHATRIIFDFDEISSLKFFEADSQATVAVRDDVLIYPMKEVLWSDELVEKAHEKLIEYQQSAIKIDEEPKVNDETDITLKKNVHLPFTDAALERMENMLTELSISHEAEGEEFFYQLLWDRQYSVADFIDENCFVFIYNYDKQINAELTIGREYDKLYRTSRENLPILPPDDVLFSEIIKKYLTMYIF